MIISDSFIRGGVMELTPKQDLLRHCHLEDVTLLIAGSKELTTVSTGCIYERCEVKEVSRPCKK